MVSNSSDVEELGLLGANNRRLHCSTENLSHDYFWLQDLTGAVKFLWFVFL